MNTKTKGNICEMKIAARMVELGHVVSFPFGENSRYDMIVDVNGQLYKIQCKSGLYNPQKGRIEISTQSIKCYRNFNEDTNVRHDYVGSADFIASFCPQLNDCYIIPINECPKGYVYLRVDPVKSNQTKGIMWAKDYKL